MKQLTLLIYLTNDPPNSLRSRVSLLSSEEAIPSLSGRDDVVLISDNAIFVDQTTAHDVFVQLCADLASLNYPYLILPLDAEFSVAVGKFPKTIKTILEKYNFSFAKP